MRLKDHRPSSRLRGFSLAELSFVLLLAGLFVGGSWYAASSYLSASKVNEAADAIVEAITNAYNFFPPENYPTTFGSSVIITSTLLNAGLLPASFKIDGGSTVRTPLGNDLFMTLSCWKGGGCQKSGDAMISVAWRGPSDTWKPGTLNYKDCNNLIAKLSNSLNQDENFLYFQIQIAGNSQYQMLYRPVNTNIIDCPANYTGVTLWYRPPAA